MRVLMTADTVGGVWSYARELVGGLLEQGVTIVLVAFGRELSDEQSFWSKAMAASWPETFTLISAPYALEWMECAGEDVAKSRSLVASLVSEYKPDLLHANQFCFASLDLGIPTFLIAHSDVVSWWYAVHGVAPPDTEWMRGYMQIVQSGIHHASMVIAPTEWMLQELTRCYGAPAQARVIANGSSPSEFQCQQPKHLQAVSCGRLWDQGKNTRLLRDVHSSVPILIAGETTPPAGSSSAALEPSADDATRCLGPLGQSEMKQLFGESALYIATSKYEPFGLAPLEAAFAGCAVVANDIPSLREVWGDDALYYKRDNSASLSHVLDALAGDPLLLHSMAGKANCRARKLYTRERMTSAYLGVYEGLMQMHGSAKRALVGLPAHA